MDQLDAAGGIAIAGAAITALSYAVKTLAKRVSVPSLRPPASTPKPSMSGQMRAVTEAMVRQQQDDMMRLQVHEMHGVVMAKDDDGAPRVQNKTSVEGAILATQRSCERQVELLEAILEALQHPPLHPTTYRKKLPSHRGGE